MFFFFKQKTAYEMRISDWSSDVCSSDLPLGQACRLEGLGEPLGAERRLRRMLQDYRIAGHQRGDDGIDGRQIGEVPGRDHESDAERLAADRSEERRVGKEWGSTCRCRGSRYHLKKTQTKQRGTQR